MHVLASGLSYFVAMLGANYLLKEFIILFWNVFGLIHKATNEFCNLPASEAWGPKCNKCIHKVNVQWHFWEIWLWENYTVDTALTNPTEQHNQYIKSYYVHFVRQFTQQLWWPIMKWQECWLTLYLPEAKDLEAFSLLTSSHHPIIYYFYKKYILYYQKV